MQTSAGREVPKYLKAPKKDGQKYPKIIVSTMKIDISKNLFKYPLYPLILLTTICLGQESFTGVIEFKTEIETTDLAPDDYKEKLLYNYGEKVSVFYLESGNFARKYESNGETGQFVKFYFAEKGILISTYKNITEADTIDVSVNSLVLKEKKKVANETILSLDCSCYEYKAINKSKEMITLTYCYSEQTPILDSNLFKLHKDFFISDFITMSNRPYLKFSLQTSLVKMTFTAIKLRQKNITMKDVLGID
ncbi:hypothetical protein [Croceiramulus getboli]|nr:hypothetical protein P8624_08915 [Flavobacteriaceae bacterium YJPT1-3]